MLKFNTYQMRKMLKFVPANNSSLASSWYDIFIHDLLQIHCSVQVEDESHTPPVTYTPCS